MDPLPLEGVALCPAVLALFRQHCSCGRYTIDADHLHTCKQHSGNWYAAHERLLTVVEQIVRAAGLRTKRRYVASSRRRRRGDLRRKVLRSQELPAARGQGERPRQRHVDT